MRFNALQNHHWKSFGGDEAITLFSNKDAVEVIIIQPIEDHIEKFNEAVKALVKIAPTTGSVDDLVTEENELIFIVNKRTNCSINLSFEYTKLNKRNIFIIEMVFEIRFWLVP